MLRLLGLASLCLALWTASALDNGLGKTPQMGWNSWYNDECSATMTESSVRATVDEFVRAGFPELGYEYINLDDCMVDLNRTADGKLQSDQKTFPSGMRALSDYVHGHHLKFGVYTDRGPQTCAGRPAAQGNEQLDAQTYAHDWQVDYVKEDSCHAPTDHTSAFTQYGLMRDALNATGRPVFFSLCGWNDWYAPQGASLANSWRTGPDDSNWPGVLKNVDIMAEGASKLGNLAQYAGPDKGWNDPCLLLSKNSEGVRLMTEQQTRTQFSLWAVLAAPLLISGSVTNMSQPDLQTYSNKDVIAVSQDSKGSQGFRVYGSSLSASGGAVNIFARHLDGGAIALLAVNTRGSTADAVCDAACFASFGWSAAQLPATGTDLWSKQAVSPVTTPKITFSGLAADGGSQLLKLLPH